MKIDVFLIILFGLLFQQVNGQEDECTYSEIKFKNSMQIMLLGHGGLYSVNYERILTKREKLNTSIDLGFSVFPWGNLRYTIPLMINEIVSFDKHHIELGTGPVFQYPGFFENYEFYLGARLLYRYQKKDGRFLMKIGFTPLIRFFFFKPFIPIVSISVGYSF